MFKNMFKKALKECNFNLDLINVFIEKSKFHFRSDKTILGPTVLMLVFIAYIDRVRVLSCA